VTNLENLVQAAIQWYEVLTTILWWKMLYVGVHHCLGGTTSLLPITQGNDTECNGVNVVVHFLKTSWFTVWDIIGQIFLVCLQYIVSKLSEHRLYVTINTVLYKINKVF
jgi:Na+/H+ antiporter NhaA